MVHSQTAPRDHRVSSVCKDYLARRVLTDFLVDQVTLDQPVHREALAYRDCLDEKVYLV